MNLKDRCRVISKDSNDSFIGLQWDKQHEVSVSFPTGYRLGKNERELKNDILSLINVIRLSKVAANSALFQYAKKDIKVTFPAEAYVEIILDYMNRGWYREYETIHRTNTSGKTSWARTIKSQTAYIQNDEIFYLNLVNRTSEVRPDRLITQIHMWCVKKAVDKLGWLFGIKAPLVNVIHFNREVFIDVIRRKYVISHKDKDRRLFLNMISLIESAASDNDPYGGSYGVLKFELVWEFLVNACFGTEIQSLYYPNSKWEMASDTVYSMTPLREDSIMRIGDEVFILDAKYYIFDSTTERTKRELPSSESIFKQQIYGAYVQNDSRFDTEYPNGRTVYNAFILPYDMEKAGTHKVFKWIGNATNDFIDGTKDKKCYEIIIGIHADTKTLMSQTSNNPVFMKEIADMIKASCNDYLTAHK